MTEDNQKQVQEKIMLYQVLQKQMEEFRQQASLIENRLTELEVTENALKEMKGVSSGDEAMFTLGGGCYGFGKLLINNKVMVEIGSGLVASKTLPDAINFIESRKAEIEGIAKNLQSEVTKVTESINQIGLEIQQLNEKSAGAQEDNSVRVD